MRANEFIFEKVIDELNIDNSRGWGATPNNANIDYMGFRVLMKPSVFLNLAHYLQITQGSQERIDIMKKYGQEGGKFGAPMLYILAPDEWRNGDLTKPGMVMGHEGRHRMFSHQEVEGDTPVETHIILKGDTIEWRNRHITKEIIDRLNQGLETEYGKTVRGPFFKFMAVESKGSYQPPSLDVGDKILKGKFKNSPAQIKGFKKDKHNQPVLKTNKGDVQLFKPRITKLMTEGGWANPATQNTHITPALVDRAIKILDIFIDELNEHLKTKNISPVELGDPCGSTTYYKRDLVQNPEREYGDIDVNLFIPRIEGMTNNANADFYRKQIKEFCEQTEDFQTENGTNVIIRIDNDYVQVDFITAYFHNKEWTRALAPEYNVKGVLCNSLYSSLGEALSLSIGGGHGVQAKTQNGKLVPFKTVKDVELTTITNNPKTWALDIAKYFGCKKISPRLEAYPGMIGEVRCSDMINSIRGIAETLELNGKGNANELISRIKDIYLGKIQKAIDSSKYEKAATPAAIEKAEKTKELLATKSAIIAKLFGV